jgi:hypothetical protein
MAITELSPESLAPASTREGVGRVRLGVHDASRVEWSVSLPMPLQRAEAYEVEFELTIPQSAFVQHAPWEHLQSFTRLDSPHAQGGDVVTIDALRQVALAFAHRVSKRSEEFQRQCRLGASLFNAKAERAFDPDTLVELVQSAEKLALETRFAHCHVRPGEPAELGRERRLVDEYVSVRLLEFLAGVGRAVAGLGQARAPQLAEAGDDIARLSACAGRALESELRYREQHGFLRADGQSLVTLERYLDRASQLKKHFQEVLFLEAETFQVAERIHHIVAAFVAVVASTWAFFWQIALANRAMSTGQIGSGLVMFAVIAGVVYAGKDRIKEIGRAWISGRVHRHYAQRVAKFRVPARRLPSRDLVATAKESFDQLSLKLPDPLNPQSGARLPAMLLRYRQRGQVLPQRELTRSGVTRVKHVFRYDLSPIFARLDDALKQVPVLDPATHCVTLVDAPRCYRVPVLVRVKSAAGCIEESGVLVMHKRGLDRMEGKEELERAALEMRRAELGSDPALVDGSMDP